MRPFLQNVIAFGVSVTLGLVVVETGLRWLETESYFLPARVNEEGYAVHVPNLDQEKFDNENKKKVHIKTNELGFVGENFKEVKPTSTLRVAFLGDSFTEAMQVDYDETTAYRLKSELESALKTITSTDFATVEVFNFGVGGSGTVDQLLHYAHYVRRYKPDVVVWQFYSGNDVADNGRYVSQVAQLASSTIDELARHPQIVAAHSNQWQDRVYRSSAIVRLLDRFVRTQPYLFSLGVKAGVFNEPVSGVATSVPEAHLYYIPSAGDHRAAAHDVTAVMLRRVAELVQADGARLVPVYIPEGTMVNESLAQKTIQQYRESGETTFATNTQYLHWVSTTTPVVPWLDLTPEFSARISNGESLYLQEIGHLNEIGHEVVTRLITQRIISLL